MSTHTQLRGRADASWPPKVDGGRRSAFRTRKASFSGDIRACPVATVKYLSGRLAARRQADPRPARAHLARPFPTPLQPPDMPPSSLL
jgi:hypothetical protein